MLKVLLADDDALVRAGLRTILSAADDITVTSEAADGAAAINAVAGHRPDVVLMDIRMPGVDGIDATSAELVANQLIPAQQRHISVLTQLINAVGSA